MILSTPYCALSVALLALTNPAAALDRDQYNAERAYNDIITRFWYGSTVDGHTVAISDKGKAVPVSTPPEMPEKGHLWEYGTGINVIYSWWKVNGVASDAEMRLLADWRWIKSFWSISDISACGIGTTSTAQDDAAWNAWTLLELYDATRDRKALYYAKAVIDCAWNRWYDSSLGGGLWYNDAHAEKSSYQSVFALDLLNYSAYAKEQSYRAKAMALDAWAEKSLERRDGLYWEGLLPSGIPNGLDRPYDIKIANSVVFLAGNMAWTVLDVRLYGLTHDLRYLNRAISAARAIRKWETIPGTNILLNDRDAFVNGTVFLPYAVEVTPYLPKSGTADASTIIATARSLAMNARGADGTYGADWQGPLEGKWYALGSTQYRLNVSAQGANVIISGYAAKK